MEYHSSKYCLFPFLAHCLLPFHAHCEWNKAARNTFYFHFSHTALEILLSLLQLLFLSMPKTTAIHSPSLSSLVKINPALSSPEISSSLFETGIPDTKSTPLSLSLVYSSFFIRSIASANIFATIKSYFPFTPSK